MVGGRSPPGSGRPSGRSSAFGPRPRTRPCCDTRPCPATEWFSGLPAELRRARPGHRRGRVRRSSPAPRPRDERRAHLGRAARPGRSVPGRPRPARRRPRRPGRRLPAQRPRGAGRLPGHRQPRRGVVLVPTGVRRRAASSTGSGSSTRPCSSWSAATATGPSPSTAPPRSTPSGRAALAAGGGRTRRQPVGGPGWASSRRARLRPRALRPPALRALLLRDDRAAQGDRPRPRRHPRSSTSRRSPSTTTWAPATGSSGSRPPGG